MASSSTEDEMFFNNMKSFPPVINGRIHLVSFLTAAEDLVSLVERLGTVFAPVKFDMQGNIDKIKRPYKFDENSCLLELMLEDKNCGKETVIEGVLWLNRALLFFELVFIETLKHLEAKCYDVNMKRIFTLAYEGSVKKYHNWVTQQLFTVICKMSPTLPQVMKSFGVDNDVKVFETKLASFNITLHLVRSGVLIKYGLNKKKLTSGNCIRRVNIRKPANSGTCNEKHKYFHKDFLHNATSI